MGAVETSPQTRNAFGSARRRSSAFTELGLEGHDSILDEKIRVDRTKLSGRFRSNVSIVEPNAIESDPPTPVVPTSPNVTQTTFLSRLRMAQMALLIALLAIVLPTLHGSATRFKMMSPLAVAGVVTPHADGLNTLPEKRQNANTAVCKRWAGQSAVVNGTVYYYGGRATTSADQSNNEWNNGFISLDLTKSWQISSPSLTGLPTPSGPPAVSLGYLWSSTDNLYLYGGEFSDTPVESPTPFSLWSYNIQSGSWNEHRNPGFEDGSAVQRAAEGAGVSVPSLGRGYYFGGHLDYLTTAGWSIGVSRVYLPSMVEFTMPGFSNSELRSSSAATGSDGAYRNITVGSSGFPERADGVLVYVPGYSSNGIIVGLAGGTNDSFTQMNVIDVYDIASSTWYKQATSGAYPDVRVNPCAVAATSADGTSTQIYMYGGQNLQPYQKQTQYDDMWILTLPSFTWIKVDQSGQSTPPARSGHMCHIWNSQMVVVGGYVGQELSCDSPGVYVFNASSLQWQNQYTALGDSDNLNRQKSQQKDPNALQGSYGYQVPKAVQSVVGGNALGSATLTAPAQTATGGPLATGKPATYTVTGSDGTVTTQTASPNPGNGSGHGSNVNVGAIVAGVVAGLFFVASLYLAFCAYIYRKQMKQYRDHVTLLQHDALNSESGRFTGTPAFAVARRGRDSNTEKSGSTQGERNSQDNRSTRSGQPESSSGRQQAEIMQHYPYNSVMALKQSATAKSSTEDLLKGQEPSFLGVLLSPRRSLRVVNQ